MKDIVIKLKSDGNYYELFFESGELDGELVYKFSDVLSEDSLLLENQLFLYREIKDLIDFDFSDKNGVYDFILNLYKSGYDLKFSKDDYISLIEIIINSEFVTMTKLLNFIDHRVGIWNYVYGEGQYTYTEGIVRNWNDLRIDTINGLNKTSLKSIFNILYKI